MNFGSKMLIEDACDENSVPDNTPVIQNETATSDTDLKSKFVFNYYFLNDNDTI